VRAVNTKLVLAASAVLLGAAGIASTFAPHELLNAAGIAPTGILAILVQLLGATWFAFAMVNWAARGSLIGGIYNRPVAIGNLTHFVIGALALVKFVLAGERHTIVIVAAAVYAVLAIAFAMVFFRSPVASAQTA
jgi:hypothetical protein